MFGLFNPVRLLLERGADPHTSTRNEPLFHLLIFESYFSLEPKEASSLPAESEDQRLIASLLTQHGVDINAVHKTNSETVLVKAIRNKWLTMAHFLLDLGVKLTAPAIHVVVWFGFGDVMGWLLVVGVDIEEGAGVTWSRDISVHYGMLLTPLHSATAQGQTEMVHFLLDRGATIDVRVRAGMTPLHLASQHGRYSVAIALLERGADVNLRMDGGVTALHLAARKGYSQVAWLLMEHGANDAALTEGGNTALDLATKNYQLAAVRVLEQRRKGRRVGKLPGSG
jgi:ankyrin repeat protein